MRLYSEANFLIASNLAYLFYILPLILPIVLQPGAALNHFVDKYDTLTYRLMPERSKRSLAEAATYSFYSGHTHDLRFRSLNRTFHLKLRPIGSTLNNVFADDHVIDVDGNNLVGREEELATGSFLYEGHVKGEPGSVVYGSVLDGVFEGHIHLADGHSYTVERVQRYLNSSSSPQFHSIIYADEHINYYNKARRRRSRTSDHGGVDGQHDDNHHQQHLHEDSSGCGLSKETFQRMRHLQESAADLPQSLQWSSKRQPVWGDGELEESIEDSFPYRYLNRSRRELLLHIRNGANGGHSSNGDGSYSRNGKAGPDGSREVNGKRLHGVRTCPVYLQADQKLYEAIFAKEGQRNHIRTREEIVSLFYNHIKAVNQIYESTDFGGVQGLNFVIQRTSIYTKETCANGKAVPGSDNPFCEDNVDVSNYLNLNSQRNHSAFCLAYALTFRDFVGGTLGLAWVASPTFSTAGGICQLYQRYNEGQQGTTYRSLNTGIITLVNYGNRVPLRVSQLTMAHEIGHNFGAPHDHTAECQPGLPDGNYIMFSSATSGDKVNNAKFSPCSIHSISNVLYEVLQQTPVDLHQAALPLFGRKRNCFQERTSAFCGNQIREPGEECDCGFSIRDCEEMGDRCCLPRELNGACRHADNARCSPSEGLCCNASKCDFHPASSRHQCRDESECLYSQYCDGRGAACPDSEKKTDGLPCQDVTKVCQNGTCDGSICAHVGLKDCFLTEGKPEQLCQLACEKNGTCYSSFNLPEFAAGRFNQPGRENQIGLLLHPGSPCNNYKGYCDILRKCRSVDSNGPLARLKNLLFNKHTIKSVSQWVQEHWWACVLIGIGVLLFMAIFVKCCAVHTPSTNPNKMPAQHFSETLRHPGTLLRMGRSPRQGAYSIPAMNVVVEHHPDHHHRHHDNRAHSRHRQSHQPHAADSAAVSSNGHVEGEGRGRRHPHNKRPVVGHQRPGRGRSSTSSQSNRHPQQPPVTVDSSVQASSSGVVPPLIAPLTQPSPSVAAAQPLNEPPPPYTPTDPAERVAAATQTSEQTEGSPASGSGQNIVGQSHAQASSALAQHPSTNSLPIQSVIAAPPLPTPASLPAVPLPPPPAIPGPPLPGQGPRPGRRKLKGAQQQQQEYRHNVASSGSKTADSKKTSKRRGAK